MRHFALRIAVLAMGVSGGALGMGSALAVPCDEADTVGGGVLGVSPGPTDDPDNALGWDVGSGQCNGSFTVTHDSAFPSRSGAGIELGLRAEERREGQVANINGEYEVQLGHDDTVPEALTRAWWNFQQSIAYDGLIEDLDGLIFSIRTDAGQNVPASPQFDLLALRAIDARNPDTTPTAVFEDLYQTSQNPEFGWFSHPNDTDANPTGNFNYEEPGAWTMTLAAVKAGQLASVNACIRTPGAACDPSVPLVYTCSGFESPLDKPVVVRKKARVLPLKMVCTDQAGIVLTDADMSAPVVHVHQTGEAAETVPSEKLTSAGKGTEGNEFVFDGNQFWYFNLSTKQFSAPGNYNITALPSSGEVLVGAPVATIIVE